jgi:hypothetical protein
MKLMERTKWQADSAFLPAAVEALEILAGAGAAAKELASKASAVIDSCRQVVEVALSEVDPLFSDEVNEIRMLCAHPDTWQSYIVRAQDLVSRNHEAARTRLQTVMQISRDLETIAAVFDRSKQTELL